jgi:hypothetical protein
MTITLLRVLSKNNPLTPAQIQGNPDPRPWGARRDGSENCRKRPGRFCGCRVERTSSRAGVAPAEFQCIFAAHCFANYQWIWFDSPESSKKGWATRRNE